MTPEQTAQIQIWRDRAARGELTLDDCKNIVEHLRAGRRGSAAVAAASKAKRAPIDGDALLAELE